MDNNIKDKIVVVTGGADGIGYFIVEHFLPEKPKAVIILDFNETKGEDSKRHLQSILGYDNVHFMKCDVTKDLEAVSRKILDEYNHVDVLVNNAGIVDETSVRKTMEINAVAVMEWTMKFWEHMRKDKGGRGGTILNIGSIYSYTVDPYLAFYKASKFAVMGLTRTLGHAENFARYGVRVVILCPGFTYTTLTEAQLCWDEQLDAFTEFGIKQKWQMSQAVGKAAVDVIKAAKSGSAWKIVGEILKEIPLVAEGEQLR